MGATRDELLDRLHDHLVATAELPVDAASGRWIGEAEAVAADARTAPEDAARRRVEQVHELLSNVDDTGSAAANEHVEAARALAERIDRDDPD